MMPPGVLFVIGASGAGKTATVRALDAEGLPGVRCYYFDTIGVPSADVMEREWGGGERWQEQATAGWIGRLVANPDGAELVVLDGQTRLSSITPHLSSKGVRHWRIVLLDCEPAVRAARLRGPRAQPHLASGRMDAWARYLREQADAMALPVLDTSRLTVDEAASALRRELEELRRQREAAA